MCVCVCYQCLQENRSVYFLSVGTPLGFVGVSKVSCDASKRCTEQQVQSVGDRKPH